MMDVKKTFVTYDVLSSLELQTIHWCPQSQSREGLRFLLGFVLTRDIHIFKAPTRASD